MKDLIFSHKDYTADQIAALTKLAYKALEISETAEGRKILQFVTNCPGLPTMSITEKGMRLYSDNSNQN